MITKLQEAQDQSVQDNNKNVSMKMSWLCIYNATNQCYCYSATNQCNNFCQTFHWLNRSFREHSNTSSY